MCQKDNVLKSISKDTITRDTNRFSPFNVRCKGLNKLGTLGKHSTCHNRSVL